MKGPEQSIISLIGKPGSGKTRLGKNLEKILLVQNHNVLHISFGDRLRKIGSGAIESAYTYQVRFHLLCEPHELMDDALTEDIMRETFWEEGVSETDILLLDGMPRRAPQVDILYGLAQAAERAVQGVIVTHVDNETARLRLLKRTGRDLTHPIDPLAISQRMQTHDKNFPDVYDALKIQHSDLPVVTIDTSGDKIDTTRLGLEAVGSMLKIKTV